MVATYNFGSVYIEDSQVIIFKYNYYNYYNSFSEDHFGLKQTV